MAKHLSFALCSKPTNTTVLVGLSQRNACVWHANLSFQSSLVYRYAFTVCLYVCLFFDGCCLGTVLRPVARPFQRSTGGRNTRMKNSGILLSVKVKDRTTAPCELRHWHRIVRIPILKKSPARAMKKRQDKIEDAGEIRALTVKKVSLGSPCESSTGTVGLKLTQVSLSEGQHTGIEIFDTEWWLFLQSNRRLLVTEGILLQASSCLLPWALSG